MIFVKGQVIHMAPDEESNRPHDEYGFYLGVFDGEHKANFPNLKFSNYTLDKNVSDVFSPLIKSDGTVFYGKYASKKWAERFDDDNPFKNSIEAAEYINNIKERIAKGDIFPLLHHEHA